MEKAGLVHPYIDKRGLHSGQDSRHFTFINVAGNPHIGFSFDEEFSELAVLHDGYTAFLRSRINKNLLFHRS